MDMFKLMNWLSDNREKILIFSHIVMVISLINLTFAVFSGRFALYPSFFMFAFSLQILVFIITQIQFKKDD